VPMKGSAGRFCSRKCSGAYRTAHLERFLCDHCGNVIEHRVVQMSEGYKNNFCSMNCHDLFRIANRQKKLVERFWKYVVMSDGCWGWSGTLDERGYGRVRTLLGRGSVDAPPRAPRLMGVASRPDPRWTERAPQLRLSTMLPARPFIPRESTRQYAGLCVQGTSPRGRTIRHREVTEAQVIEMRLRFAAGERNYSKLGQGVRA
jgi:hypothetical protein